MKRYPSILRQIAISKTEPGDENNQDISALVGKVDIRKLEQYAQDDADAYSYSGGWRPTRASRNSSKCSGAADQGVASCCRPPRRKALQGHGRVRCGFLFDGDIWRTDESEWKAFRNNRNNEALLDRIYIVKVPYCLRVSEEIKIWR